MRLGHLDSRVCTLHTLSPVFVGSGQKLSKREYLMERDTGKIKLVDMPKLLAFLTQRKLLDSYERFLLAPGQNADLLTFLRDNRIWPDDYSAFVLYELQAGMAMRDARFRELLLCVKDGASGKPYIPGSSIKGALRTALAALLIERQYGGGKRRALQPDAGERNPARIVEQRLFTTLDLNAARKTDVVNDVMRAVHVSDTQPIGFENLIMCGKLDRRTDGGNNIVPLYRECIRPGARLRFEITTEPLLLKRAGLCFKDLTEALESFDESCYSVFSQHFKEDEKDADTAVKKGYPVTLGGGAGFVSKTFAYQLYGDQAVKWVSGQMIRSFPRHKHEQDITLGVSPHTTKIAQVGGQYYPYGRCELLVEGE